MTARHRFRQALACDAPDGVPIFEQLYNLALYEQLLGTRPRCYDNRLAIALTRQLQLDAVLLVHRDYPGFLPASAAGRWTNDWGVTYQMPAHAWPTGTAVAFAVDSPAAVRRLQTPQPPGAGVLDSLAAEVALAHEHGLGAVTAMRGPFAFLAWHFLGMEAAMLALCDERKLIDLALSKYIQFHEAWAAQLAKTGVDAVFLTEDLGSSAGPLIDPDVYAQLFQPVLAKVIAPFRSAGVHVILHSDGNIMRFVETLLAAGISALHPIERSAGMNMRHLKQQYAGRLCLIGNVDTKTVLSRGRPQSVREEVQRCLREGSPGGGYVLSSDHSFSNEFPVENLLAMVDAAHELTRRPPQSLHS